jgi:hypothetical protein
MKKTTLLLGLILLFILTSNSCKKEEEMKVNDSKQPDAINIITNQVTYYYNLDGLSYLVVMNLLADSTFECASAINETLTEALDTPNSTLLKDPFNENSYFVFRTEEESKGKNEQILEQLNQFENKNFKSFPKNGVYGSVELYYDAYFKSYIPYYDTQFISDGGFTGLYPSDNDKLSSYKVYSNTFGARSDGKRFVLRFFENGNYGGHVLTAYSFFESWWVIGADLHICWYDSNMHGTLMTGGLRKKYWGDQVSSFNWKLE